MQLGLYEGLDTLKISLLLASDNLKSDDPLLNYVRNSYAEACLKYRRNEKEQKIMPNFRITSKTSSQSFKHADSYKMISKTHKSQDSSSGSILKVGKTEVNLISKGGSYDHSMISENWSQKIGSQKKLKPSPRITEGIKKMTAKARQNNNPARVSKSRSGRKIKALNKNSSSEKISQASSSSSLIQKSDSPLGEIDRITSISEKIERLKNQLSKFEEVCKPLRALDLESLDSQGSSERLLKIRDQSARIIQNKVKK